VLLSIQGSNADYDDGFLHMGDMFRECFGGLSIDALYDAPEFGCVVGKS